MPAALRVIATTPWTTPAHGEELTTDEWLRVLREARELGAVQLGFSGGEPLVRDDLEILVAEAHRLGYYTNLITSGVGLTEKRIAAFKEAGLDHIQLSFQDSTQELNDFLTQYPHLRSEGEGGQADQAVRLSDRAQRGAASAQHRPHRADPGHGRGHGRRVSRARQYPVLRLGHAESRPAAADARTSRARRGDHQRLPRAHRRQDAGVFRRSRLLRQGAPRPA